MSNKNTNSNKQIVNIILRDLISRKKRRKPKPKQEEQPQIEPETLAAAAQRVRPVFFPPTNVIYSNPQGAQQSAMMDVAKQSQLNQYENIRQSLDQGLSEIQDQLAVLQTTGGDQQTIDALKSELQLYKEYINAENQSVGASEASVNNESAMSTPYKAPEEPETNNELSFQNPVFEEEQPEIKQEEIIAEPVKPDPIPQRMRQEIMDDSPYNADIQIDPPIPQVGTSTQEWRRPEYSVMFTVRESGPYFSKEFKTNNDMINTFTEEFDNLRAMYNALPEKGKYTSAKYKEFSNELASYLFKYSKAYARMLTSASKKDKQFVKTIDDIIQQKKVSVKYPTFTRLTNKLLKAMKKAR